MDNEQPRSTDRGTSRYLAVSRRSMLTGLTGLAAGGALAACSDGDQDAFGTTVTVDPSSVAAAPSAAGTDGGSTGTQLPSSAAMVISFTFTSGSEGGRGPARNPYIAVWIETPAEELVTTIALWHLQQNERWLGELKRWYAMAGGDGESVSSATRVPGDYTVEWDCADASGTKVTAGEYFVCVEGAREHGPYELIREPITLGDTPVEQELPPANELTAASVTYSV